jgi:ATP-binding cassette subfamily B protein
MGIILHFTLKKNWRLVRKEMKKVKINTFIRFMKLLGKRGPLYIISILLMTAGSSAFAVISSLLLKQIFEIAQNGQSYRLPAIILTNFFVGLVSISIFGVFMAIYNIEAKRGSANTQKLVLAKIMKLPMSYYESHHSGDIISKSSCTNYFSNCIFSSNVYIVHTGNFVSYCSKCIIIACEWFVN